MISKSSSDNVVDILSNREFEEQTYLLATFLSLVYAKKQLSPVIFFITVYRSPMIKEMYMEMTNCSFFEIVQNLCQMFPIISKSKKIKNFIRTHDIKK